MSRPRPRSCAPRARRAPEDCGRAGRSGGRRVGDVVASHVESAHLTESAKLLERARGLIPGASQTVSKGPTQWAQGVAPSFVERAQGVTVWDVDGSAYLDFPMGLGPVILGHAYPAVNEAIARQLEDGITYTLPHRLEVEVAERI